MFTRNDTNGCIDIVDLPATYQMQILRYVWSTGSAFTAGDGVYRSCDACGKICEIKRADCYLCVKCLDILSTWTQVHGRIMGQTVRRNIEPKPQIQSPSALQLNAKRAFGILLSVGFEQQTSTVYWSCDICIHVIAHDRLRLSRNGKLIAGISMCSECHTAANMCATDIKKGRALIAHVTGDLGADVSRVVREYVYMMR